MDTIAGLLDGPRAQGAFVLRVVMSGSWGMDIRDRAPLTVAALVSGEAWLSPSDGDPVRMVPGEISIIRGDEPYVLSSAPDAPVDITVLPGNHCVDAQGRSLEEPLTHGVRTWGVDPDGDTVMIVGTYEHLGEAGTRLLAALPTVLTVRGDDIGSPVVDMIAAELAREMPGQEVVIDRVLDLLTVSVLRAWFDRAGAEAPGWWRAASDPVVGPALRLLQHNPEHRWTIASLAREVGTSRAALARRFRELVGQPPMAFLTEWRMELAADLLLEPGASVGSVASRVGYGTGFALSAAFKRHRGVSPSEHRARARVA